MTNQLEDGAEEDQPPGDSRSLHEGFLATVVALLVFGLWLPQLGSSLRLDETATFWITHDGLNEVIHRAARFEPESPAYFVATWLAQHITGHSEAGMRTLSLIAMLITLVLVAKIAKRIFDRETGILAAVILAAFEGVAFTAGDARPYALSIAAVSAAALFLHRWLESKDLANAIGFILLATFAIYLQYLSLVVLVGFWLFALAKSSGVKDRVQLLTFGLSAQLLLIPTLPQIAAVWHRRSELAVGIKVTVPRLIESVLPPLLVGAILLGILIATVVARNQVHVESEPSGDLTLPIVWTLTLPLALFVFSLIGSTVLFDPRFFFFALPGAAILIAWAVRRVGPPLARRIAITTFAVISIFTLATTIHAADRWREASKLANSVATAQTPVLVRSGFIESGNVTRLNDPETRRYLLSPVTKYPIRGRVQVVPYDLRPASKIYLGRLLLQLEASNRPLVYVSLIPDDIGIWLQGRLEAMGFKTREVGRAGAIIVLLFDRPSLQS